jgi:ABC-2 type transport system permease protein
MRELMPHEMTRPEVSNQLTAVADLRWRMFLNGLRSRRGKMELASRLVITLVFVVGGIGGFFVAAGSAWYVVSQNNAEYLAVLLWPIFFFWQLFPVMSTAFANNPDSTDLLRFPLPYRTYFLLRLVYGYFDPASALGTVGLVGILLGAGVARPSLLPWILLVLSTFAVFNLVLMQAVFTWLERWLAQRRTREIMGVLFILAILSFQLIGPVMARLDRAPHPEINHAIDVGTRVQMIFPPGLAANAISQVSHGQILPGLSSLLLLGILTAALGALLHLRLRAQFRGENLSEAAARPVIAPVRRLQVGWDLPGFSSSVAAVFEKEMR